MLTRLFSFFHPGMKDVSAETVSSWIERIQELTEGYSIENIWNMNKTGWFFKALP